MLRTNNALSHPLAQMGLTQRMLARICLTLAVVGMPIFAASVGAYPLADYSGTDDNSSGFVLPIDHTVMTAAVQADGKILVGGYFSAIGTHPRSRLARFHADGSLDLDFVPVVNGNRVLAITVQRSGKILVGGVFDSIDVDGFAVARKGIARLNSDGSLDAGFNPVLDGSVWGMAEQADGDILISGSFDAVDGLARRTLARLHASGAVDTDFFVPIVGNVNALTLQSDGRIVIGGQLLYVHSQQRQHLARLLPNGALDATFTGESALNVNSLATQGDDRILVGSQGSLFRLDPDGSPDSSFQTSSGGVASIAIQENGSLVASGSFHSLGGQQREFLARLDAGGVAEAEPGLIWPDAAVHGVALLADGALLAFGAFTEVAFAPHSRIVRLDAVADSMQTLELRFDHQSALWQRGGSLPELRHPRMELSIDDVDWSERGSAVRVAGGWLFEGLELPRNQDFALRASGEAPGGYRSGSVSQHLMLVEDYLTAYTVTAVASGNGTITPALQTVDHGSSIQVTVTPAPDHFAEEVQGDTCTPSDTGDGIWSITEVLADCVITARFASSSAPQLTITLDDTRDYARYGAVLDYQVTASNHGVGDATGVRVEFILPSGIDVAQASWTCTGSGAGAHCVEAGDGALDDASVVIPAGRSLTWRITAPVRANAPDATIDVTARLSHGAATFSATASTILVLLRDGFEDAELDYVP